ncbi:MAG: hypothetical protein IKQ44_01845 [Lachnospiraceae bacterium]|nr:hypothetical protein [Lachnospiraceae bacterium]
MIKQYISTHTYRIFAILLLFSLSVLISCKDTDSDYGRYYKKIYIKDSDSVETHYMILSTMFQVDHSFEEFDCRKETKDNNSYIDENSLKKLAVLNGAKIVSYETYKEICEKFGFNQEYSDAGRNYIIAIWASERSFTDFLPIDIEEYDDKVIFYYYVTSHGYMATGTGDFCVIPTSKSLDTPLITQRCYFEDEITNIITSKDMNE